MRRYQNSTCKSPAARQRLDRKTIRLSQPVVPQRRRKKNRAAVMGIAGPLPTVRKSLEGKKKPPEEEEQGGVSSVHTHGWLPLAAPNRSVYPATVVKQRARVN
jgi:hypothetical protein